jgi:predicted Zn-dependent protease
MRVEVRTMAALLCLFVGACTVNPVTGKNQLDLMGETQEVQLGAELYPYYTQESLGAIADPKVEAYLQRVGESLAAVGHRPQLDYSYNGVNDPVVNAYALPGGKISVARGLLSRMNSEDELAAVLGHETGHVTARHAAAQYSRQMLAQLLVVGGAVALDAADVKHAELYTLGGMVGAQLFLARYSRDQERQADQLGMDYMVAAGYNPKGMVDLLGVLVAQQQRDPDFIERMFASHPMSAERYDVAKARLARQPAEVLERPLRQSEYRQRMAIVTRQQEAYDRLGEAQRLLVKEDFRAAERLLQQSSDEWPSDGVLRAFLAISELKQKRLDAAMTNADRAGRNAPEVFLARMIAGQALLAGKRWDDALPHTEAAVRILPGSAPAQLALGVALENVGRRADAVAAYQEARRLDPEGETGQAAGERLRRLGSL